MNPRRWVKLYVFWSLLLISSVVVINYIVDPYSLTRFNVLDIPLKLVSDDRSEKIARIKKGFDFDNVLLGSSRVYLINPLVVNKYVDGSTYNLGVGTAQMEDHLGFLLYLDKLNMFPKLVIMGLDFYSFNENLESNKYFVRNEELNFIASNPDQASYIAEFFSFQMFRASLKTLKIFTGMKDGKARFDEYGSSGGAAAIFDYFPEDTADIDIYSRSLKRRDSDFIRTPPYEVVSERRLSYLKKAVALCKKNDTKLIVFVTPLYARLLDDIHNDAMLSASLNEFKSRLASITSYYDFLTYNEVTRSSFYFGDTSHLKHETGNLILARLFNDPDVEVPEGFGVYREKSAQQDGE